METPAGEKGKLTPPSKTVFWMKRILIQQHISCVYWGDFSLPQYSRNIGYWHEL